MADHASGLLDHCLHNEFTMLLLEQLRDVVSPARAAGITVVVHEHTEVLGSARVKIKDFVHIPNLLVYLLLVFSGLHFLSLFVL